MKMKKKDKKICIKFTIVVAWNYFSECMLKFLYKLIVSLNNLFALSSCTFRQTGLRLVQTETGRGKSKTCDGKHQKQSGKRKKISQAQNFLCLVKKD